MKSETLKKYAVLFYTMYEIWNASKRVMWTLETGTKLGAVQIEAFKFLITLGNADFKSFLQ